jgi:DNA-binding MarR family transcriptional regulator
MLWNRPDPVFGFLVHDISRMLRKRFDRRARDIGLTKSQWIVLAHLARHEGIHQGGLADILELEPATLARHLDRLEDTGWIERRPDPSDRRAWRLHLTGKATPVLEKMGALVEITTREALAGLSLEERERLQAQLLTIRANLTDRPEAEAPAAEEEAAGPQRMAAGAD